ncbi:MAG: DUF393 domain-containing protein [Caulobacterales bacterium]|nr:DUF393 domain-containing protein [Caulobacterales bacterium]MCA0372405.1 DUF393 domain-containing protein [Pseudomonadota bacterium]
MQNGECFYIYDGECPLCANFAGAISLRKEYPKLKIINARENSPPKIMQEIKNRGLNLDKGAVLILDGQFYFGKDAASKIAQISTPKNLTNFLNNLLFQNQNLAVIFYPIARFIRDSLLFIRGKKRIGNLNE